jgi:hypothetical protein
MDKDMTVKFRKKSGDTSIDSRNLLIGENELKQKEYMLIPGIGPQWYQLWRMRIAKRTILKKFEILTGKRHFEHEHSGN